MLTINVVPIDKIFDALGIHYDKQGNVLTLWQDEKQTDGWRANISANYVNDFSMKDRAIGWPYAFVKKYLWLTDKETFERFQNNCWILGDVIKNSKSSYTKSKQQKIPSYQNNR